MSDECTAYPSDLTAALNAAILENTELQRKYNTLLQAAKEIAKGHWGYYDEPVYLVYDFFEVLKELGEWDG